MDFLPLHSFAFVARSFIQWWRTLNLIVHNIIISVVGEWCVPVCTLYTDHIADNLADILFFLVLRYTRIWYVAHELDAGAQVFRLNKFFGQREKNFSTKLQLWSALYGQLHYMFPCTSDRQRHRCVTPTTTQFDFFSTHLSNDMCKLFLFSFCHRTRAFIPNRMNNLILVGVVYLEPEGRGTCVLRMGERWIDA